ncbi:unnamed protein product [Ostreobium quekettii]|uniref:Uncharacterized protein n=1 Tax=Ostreobium quekettii TaxID=121088 RepID=A0A8S1IQL8_9CHLO|nr:unnamed protein product [Ostreobium quekettii]
MFLPKNITSSCHKAPLVYMLRTESGFSIQRRGDNTQLIKFQHYNQKNRDDSLVPSALASVSIMRVLLARKLAAFLTCLWSPSETWLYSWTPSATFPTATGAHNWCPGRKTYIHLCWQCPALLVECYMAISTNILLNQLVPSTCSHVATPPDFGGLCKINAYPTIEVW